MKNTSKLLAILSITLLAISGASANINSFFAGQQVPLFNDNVSNVAYAQIDVDYDQTNESLITLELDNSEGLNIIEADAYIGNGQELNVSKVNNSYIQYYSGEGSGVKQSTVRIKYDSSSYTGANQLANYTVSSGTESASTSLASYNRLNYSNSGNGSQIDPYKIDSYWDYSEIPNYELNYELSNSIDSESKGYDSYSINYLRQFKDLHFSGNGNTVKDLRVTGASSLFADLIIDSSVEKTNFEIVEDLDYELFGSTYGTNYSKLAIIDSNGSDDARTFKQFVNSTINDSYINKIIDNNSDGFADTINKSKLSDMYFVTNNEASFPLNTNTIASQTVNSEFKDVYYDKNVSSSVGVSNATGLTTSEMQGGSASNNMDFDFADTWSEVVEGSYSDDGYPILQSNDESDQLSIQGIYSLEEEVTGNYTQNHSLGSTADSIKVNTSIGFQDAIEYDVEVYNTSSGNLVETYEGFLDDGINRIEVRDNNATKYRVFFKFYQDSFDKPKIYSYSFEDANVSRSDTLASALMTILAGVAGIVAMIFILKRSEVIGNKRNF